MAIPKPFAGGLSNLPTLKQGQSQKQSNQLGEPKTPKVDTQTQPASSFPQSRPATPTTPTTPFAASLPSASTQPKPQAAASPATIQTPKSAGVSPQGVKYPPTLYEPSPYLFLLSDPYVQIPIPASVIKPSLLGKTVNIDLTTPGSPTVKITDSNQEQKPSQIPQLKPLNPMLEQPKLPEVKPSPVAPMPDPPSKPQAPAEPIRPLTPATRKTPATEKSAGSGSSIGQPLGPTKGVLGPSTPSPGGGVIRPGGGVYRAR